jgi:hypothetical protein
MAVKGGRMTKENIAPKGPAKPNTMKKAPATGMKTSVTKAGAKPVVKATSNPTMKPKAPVTKPKEKMTPQDAAMKKILEKKNGKIYG